jgi:ubiquitin-protein ligase
MKEFSELRDSPSPEFTAAPLEDNILEWHFTLRGPPVGGFSGGRYHGRLVFPPEYPFKPPDVFFLTQSGRFEINKKICLSLTGYHPEHWRPAWGVSTALIAIISFFPTAGEGAIGALDYSEEERTFFAKESRKYVCPTCGSKNADALPDESVVPSSKLDAIEGIEFGKHDPSVTVLTDSTAEPEKEREEEFLNLQDSINEIQTLVPPKYFKYYEKRLKDEMQVVDNVEKITLKKLNILKKEIQSLEIGGSDLNSLNRVKTRLSLIEPLTKEQSRLYLRELIREELLLHFKPADVGEIEDLWIKKYSNQKIIHYLELKKSFLVISKNMHDEISHSRFLSSMDLSLLILGLLIFLLIFKFIQGWL